VAVFFSSSYLRTTTCRDSSVNMVTRLESCFHSGQEKDIFLFYKASRPHPGPTQPPIQWVTALLFLGVKPRLITNRSILLLPPPPPFAFTACIGTSFVYTVFHIVSSHVFVTVDTSHTASMLAIWLTSAASVAGRCICRYESRDYVRVFVPKCRFCYTL
jgi:hypothetical protein